MKEKMEQQKMDETETWTLGKVFSIPLSSGNRESCPLFLSSGSGGDNI